MRGARLLDVVPAEDFLLLEASQLHLLSFELRFFEHGLPPGSDRLLRLTEWLLGGLDKARTGAIPTWVAGDRVLLGVRPDRLDRLWNDRSRPRVGDLRYLGV